MTLLNDKRPLMLYFYTDPGHGWLAVKRELLLNLGSIVLAISSYSYQLNEVVYLEEDCDAGHFISAMKVAGINIGLIYQHSDLPSQIRQFERFALTASEQEQLKPSFTACLRQVAFMFEETGLLPGAGL